jgi:hypothetical protein
MKTNRYVTPTKAQALMTGATLLAIGEGRVKLFYSDGSSESCDASVVNASVVNYLDLENQWFTVVDRIQTAARLAQ